MYHFSNLPELSSVEPCKDTESISSPIFKSSTFTTLPSDLLTGLPNNKQLGTPP